MSRVVGDSTGLSIRTAVAGRNSVGSKEVDYAVYLEIGRHHRRDSLADVIDRIDELLHRHFPFLHQFSYRYYDISTYKFVYSGSPPRDSILMRSTKIDGMTFIEIEPEGSAAEWKRHNRIIDSMLRVRAMKNIQMKRNQTTVK